MTTKQWILMGMVALLFLLIGASMGVTKYRHQYPITKVYEDGSFYGCMAEESCND